MNNDSGERAREAFLEVVENQLRDLKPPETRETFERLQRAGSSSEEAKRLIAAVLACEFFEMAKHQKPYDQMRYVGWLKQLPKMPYDR